MLGLPAYGYVSRSTAETLRSRRRSPTGLVKARDVATTDPTANGSVIVTVTSEAGSADSGEVQFNSLITQGALVRNAPGASPAFVGAGGFQRQWDACSSTVSRSLHVPVFKGSEFSFWYPVAQPFLRSPYSQQIVTYDDPESLGLKAAFVTESGILGVNMWDAHGDTREWDLVDGIRKGLGIS